LGYVRGVSDSTGSGFSPFRGVQTNNAPATQSRNTVTDDLATFLRPILRSACVGSQIFFYILHMLLSF